MRVSSYRNQRLSNACAGEQSRTEKLGERRMRSWTNPRPSPVQTDSRRHPISGSLENTSGVWEPQSERDLDRLS